MQTIIDANKDPLPTDFKYPDTGADVTADTMADEAAEKYLNPTEHASEYLGHTATSSTVVIHAENAGDAKLASMANHPSNQPAEVQDVA
jgi:hypothetical protein